MLFLLIGAAGLAALALSLVFDDILDGLLGIDAPFLSFPALSAGTAMFGFVAFLSDEAGMGTVATLGLAVGVALAVAVLLGLLVKSLRNASTDSTPSERKLVGVRGHVTSAITADSYGQVALTLGGHGMRYSARSDVPVPSGSEVEVTHVLSSTAVRVIPVVATLSVPEVI